LADPGLLVFSAFTYMPQRLGGLGLPNIKANLDIAWVSQAYKYPENKDIRVKGMAIRRTAATMEARRGTDDDSPKEIAAFLNSSPEGDLRIADIRSLFSLVKGALSRLGADL